MYKQENLNLMLHFEYLIPKIISEGFHKSKKQHKISEGLLDKEKKKGYPYKIKFYFKGITFG